MTTNAYTPKYTFTGSFLSHFRETISNSRTGRLLISVTNNSYSLFSRVLHSLAQLQGHNDVVCIADIYDFRARNQMAARTMGCTHLESEAALMLLRQQRLIL